MPESRNERIEMGLHLVPEHMHEAVRRYIYDGRRPGDFLTALLTGGAWDEVLMRADDINQQALLGWGRFIHNYLPKASWGDRQALMGWIDDVDGVRSRYHGVKKTA